MASSGSRILGQATLAVADAADVVADALPLDLDTLTNRDLANLPSAELVVHLHGDGRIGSDDVALVLAARDRRLAEAEDRARAADAAVAGLRDTIRALELTVANAEAEAEAEADEAPAREPARRRRIGVVPDLNLTPSEIEEEEEEEQLTGADDEIIGARDLTPTSEVGVPEQQLAAGDDEIRAPADLVTANNEMIVVEPEPEQPEIPAAGDGETTPGVGVCFDAGAAGVTAVVVPAEDGDEVAAPEQRLAGDDEIRVPDLVTAKNNEMIVDVPEPEPELPAGNGEATPGGVCFDAGAGGVTTVIPAEDDGDDDDVPCPTPLMTIEAADAFPVTAAAADDEVLEHIVLGKRKEPAADVSLTLDELRVTGCKHVSEEEAQGEDMGASHHRRSQGEQQPARATKKARKHKGIYFHFHTLVLKALKEKEEFVKKKEKKEALAKEVAAAASKQLHWQHCGCWLNAPYLP